MTPVPTAAQIEWWTGEKIGFETADDLRISEFTNGPRRISDYLITARVKRRRREEEHRMWQRWMVSGPPGQRNKVLRYRLHQKVQARCRNRYWRMWSYPNLRRAWAARRLQCARARAEREVRARREKILKSIELYQYSTRKDI